jgi:hypothetical protein
MTDYRRIYIPGSTWFFTVNLAERRNNYLLVEKIDLLRAAFRYVKERKPYRINAVVIMPDHLHCIWTLPLETGIFPYAGICSKAIFPVPCRKAREFPQAGANAGNAAYGSAGSGRIGCVTKPILTTIWTTSIGILSSMAMYGKLPTGRIRVFIGLLSRCLPDELRAFG